MGLGLVVGVILIAKLLEYLFEKHKTGTYFGIIGFLLASIIVLIIPIDFNLSIIEIIIGILLFIIGIFAGYKLGDK
jgi:putative membrane protein